jgi:site-specific DNA-methyltransferase (adenine-specific)
MIFADPPDNLGVKYDGFEDKWPSRGDYFKWLLQRMTASLSHATVCWWSVYDKNLSGFLILNSAFDPYEPRLFMWRFTFGQHRQTDCGNGFRPLLRLAKPEVTWNTSDIRVPSKRQELGDPRADTRGRVPDDVWEFPRVCGTFKERRKYHPNQHPEALIERMVRMSTNPGDLVIDLFGGTFTTARVCERLERDCISIEISKAYCKHGAEELGVEVEHV